MAFFTKYRENFLYTGDLFFLDKMGTNLYNIIVFAKLYTRIQKGV